MDSNSSNFFQTDCDSIVSQLEDQEERIRLKRRWLLGLSEDHTLEKSDFLESDFLPESLLREDDIFYETVKSRVEEGFGIRKKGEVPQKESKLCTKDVVKTLDLSLDSLTTKGLYLIATIVTRDSTSTSFEKTRSKMKKIIRESIRRDFRERRDDTGTADIVKQMHQVLSDPRNFRKNCKIDLSTPTFESHRDAITKVLNELDKLSTQTLLAMKRKLKGSRTIPRFNISSCSMSRGKLMDQVRQASEKMLSTGDKLQEPLAKAVLLADLSLKVSSGYKAVAAADFLQLSPETKKLQNEIVKAVWLISSDVVSIDELESLRLILDPEAKVSNNSLRLAVKTMLIEYLFECSDMDIIPESLTKALSLVNESPRNVEYKEFPREAIEEETECVLNVSAQVKQMFWQCIPHYELEQDFGDAYMEELVDSDDDDDDGTQDDASDSSSPDNEEGGAECSFLDLAASTYTINQQRVSSSVVVRDLSESVTRAHRSSLFVTPTSNKSTLNSGRHDIDTSKVKRDIEMEVDDNQFSSRSLFSVENIQSDDHHGEQNPLRRNKNQYLAVQEICDETSLVAHNLIGRLLEKFADREGVELEADERSYLRGEPVEGSEEKQASSLQEKSNESIIVSVVKELMPSLDNNVLMRLKEIWSSNGMDKETTKGIE
ncbi:unnamed protein product [Thlaspi arvense]|uniref:Uncharacterized protein n=1 Tax=Thlaspi arvense TaxID=13288 RepID=A0AAU9T8Y0_THLAR|nr:unnamed protein product [Thlaspi arvense]